MIEGIVDGLMDWWIDWYPVVLSLWMNERWRYILGDTLCGWANQWMWMWETHTANTMQCQCLVFLNDWERTGMDEDLAFYFLLSTFYCRLVLLSLLLALSLWLYESMILFDFDWFVYAMNYSLVLISRIIGSSDNEFFGVSLFPSRNSDSTFHRPGVILVDTYLLCR